MQKNIDFNNGITNRSLWQAGNHSYHTESTATTVESIQAETTVTEETAVAETATETGITRDTRKIWEWRGLGRIL